MLRWRWLAIAGLTLLGALGLQRHSDAERARDAAQRGRAAKQPWHMTLLGWRDVLSRTIAEIGDDRVLAIAAGVAFYFLLALVPGVSALVSVYGLFADPGMLRGQLGPMVGLMPPMAAEILDEQVRRLTAQPADTLSIYLALSLTIALWSASAGMKAIFDALNVIYDEKEKRSFLHFNALAFATMVCATVLLALILFAVALLPSLLRLLPFSAGFELIVRIARWPIFFALAATAIAVLYWIGPSRRAARFAWVLPGAILASLAWVGASWLFGWYASTLGDYTATYGSLAAIVVFMTWLWLSASIILIGAEINAELEHQTALDTTTGPPKPLGTRGATVADHVGPAVVRAPK